MLPGVLLAAGLQLGAGPAAHAESDARATPATEAGSADRTAPEGKLRLADAGETAVPDSWIVVLRQPAGAAPAASSSAPASADVPAVARDSSDAPRGRASGMCTGPRCAASPRG
ncbi:serine protease [Streptomyces alboflavus]|uniref:Serine protease n=1 Tax=Streptomyces alboflavus TaxID=67267 RepID=A0A1Z1WQM7_9ACTN|nr:serine protease [Streptomyces alboflavus]